MDMMVTVMCDEALMVMNVMTVTAKMKSLMNLENNVEF